MTKTMTNLEIYTIANSFAEAFTDDSMYLPAKLNFYIQKNRSLMASLSTDIEKARDNIVLHYGEPTEDGGYQIPPERVSEANDELNELLTVEQEVTVYTISLDALDGIDLTAKQMQVLLFMIEEPV